LLEVFHDTRGELLARIVRRVLLEDPVQQIAAMAYREADREENARGSLLDALESLPGERLRSARKIEPYVFGDALAKLRNVPLDRAVLRLRDLGSIDPVQCRAFTCLILTLGIVGHLIGTRERKHDYEA
jgi:hypothetical protein